MALEEVKHPLLHLAIHMAFVYFARSGEVLALTWDNVDLEKGIVKIDKTIQRINKSLLANTSEPPLVIFPNADGGKREQEIKAV